MIGIVTNILGKRRRNNYLAVYRSCRRVLQERIDTAGGKHSRECN